MWTSSWFAERLTASIFSWRLGWWPNLKHFFLKIFSEYLNEPSFIDYIVNLTGSFSVFRFFLLLFLLMFLDKAFPFGTEVWFREGHLMKALPRIRRRRFSSENTYSLFGVLMHFWYAKRHPGTKKFDKLLQPFQHHGQRRWHSLNRRVGAVCVCSLWRWGERNDLWCSRQREQNGNRGRVSTMGF